MALWYRVGSNRLRPVSQRIYSRLSALSAASPPALSPDLSNAPPVRSGAALSFIQLRSFAAPVQTKQKLKSSEDASAGPRINKAITAPVIRLVTDEGHCVVSLREALDRAMRLDLDLVEVQRAANPPVCKIMDFNKEKYKKELTERERSKTKSALSKRSGEKKEVRFKAKTELKDLKVKADGITRLMERGYRVKCTALPSGNQEEALGEHLSRLLKLIEEVSVIESGPHVDPKQAYAIVRHIKFETKKSSKKSNKISVDQTKPSQTPAMIPAEEEESEWECDSDSDDSKVEQIPRIPSGFEKSNQNKPALGSVRKEEPVQTEMNRYAKKEPNQPIAPNNSRGYNSRDSFNQAQVPFNNNFRDYNGRESSFDQGRVHFNNNGYNPPRQFQPGKFGPNIPNRNLGNPNFSEQRSNLPPFQSPNLGPSIPNRNLGNPNFSQQRTNLPPFQAPKFGPNVPNGNPGNPNFSQQRSNVPRFEAPKFGPNNPNGYSGNPNFSQQGSNVSPFQPPNIGQFRKEGPVNPNSSPQKSFVNPNFSQQRSSADEPPKPKFGIFNSSSKSPESSNSGSQMPKFGIFSSKRTDIPNN